MLSADWKKKKRGVVRGLASGIIGSNCIKKKGLDLGFVENQLGLEQSDD